MTAPTFHRPQGVGEVLQLLATPGAQLLAGGASLVAMMNAGLLAPASIVSLKDIASLRGVRHAADGSVRIGAMTRHRETAEDERLIGSLMCLRTAAGSIGNPAVRNMGTIGGAVALADPGADYPAALVALQATVELASRGGTRCVPAREFFLDWYTTAARAEEFVTAILLPVVPPGIGLYRKLARVHGDFAIASIALCVSRRGEFSVAIGGCGPAPIFSAAANEIITSHAHDPAAVREAGDILSRLADPVDDVRASGDYRRLVIPRLVASAVLSVRTQLECAA